MRKIYQKYRHEKDDDLSFGDCLRCVLASVLELDRDSVPHFRHGERDTPEGRGRLWWQVRQWLQSRGLGLFQHRLKAETLSEALEWCRIHNGDQFVMLGGLTSYGGAHVVVVQQGKIAHDPHSDEPSSLSRPLEDGHWVVLAVTHCPELRADLLAASDEPVEIPPLPDFSLLDKHERIALSFSGGKDSLALVHLLRPYWDRLRIYHVSTSDLLPETVEIVRAVEAMVPNWCEITTNSIAYQEKFGLVSDIVPYEATLTGRALLHGNAGRTPIVGRAECCNANLWAPLQARLTADRITLSIRGTRRSDPAWGWLMASGSATGPATFQDGPLTVWTPIHDWTIEQVFKYLQNVGAPIAAYYEEPYKHSGPECARCTGWLDEAKGAYLRRHHPAIAADYLVRLSRVRSALQPTLRRLEAEMDVLTAPVTQEAPNVF